MTTPSPKRPIPVDPTRLRLDPADESQGTLLGTRCLDCGVYLFGAAVFCQACSSARLEGVELSREGTLYSYTIVRVPPEGWPGPVPYVLGEVELPEGPHILAEVVGAAHEELSVGIRVKLTLQPVPSASDASQTLMVYKWAPMAGTPEASGGG